MRSPGCCVVAVSLAAAFMLGAAFAPASQAGLKAGTQILAVNGIAYEAGVLSDAIRAAQANHAAMQLILKAGSRFRVAQLEYHDGWRYPQLERDPDVAARLDEILSARTP